MRYYFEDVADEGRDFRLSCASRKEAENYLQVAWKHYQSDGWHNGSHNGDPVLLLKDGKRHILRIVEVSSSE